MLSSVDVIKESGVQFGTSGARGLVTQFTNQACAAFTHAFINTMKQWFKFKYVAVAIDNRPSSEYIARACIDAIKKQGLEPIYYGVIPTPALASSAMEDNIPCIMVTGSHIPFDRNGLKFYRPDGEITKLDEQDIINIDVIFETSPEISVLPCIDSLAGERYISRYLSIFDGALLTGKRIGIYEHSSAGRDLYSILFKRLGAETISLERSDQFIPIDTEAVSETDKAKAKMWSEKYQLDAIFSTDGDGDRPLVADENGEWLRGDILGLLCAQEMKTEALAVPVSCNTVIEMIPQFSKVSRTRIGSPYVIEEFAKLKKHYHSVSGFEANGGYLLGSDVKINGKCLKALPTRDAVLPAIMLLAAAKDSGIAALVNALPARYTYSDRIQDFPTEKSLSLLERGKLDPANLVSLVGFNNVLVEQIDTTDGLRLTLPDKTIFHLRSSGNAPELRCYAEANTFEKAQAIVIQVLEKIKNM